MGIPGLNNFFQLALAFGQCIEIRIRRGVVQENLVQLFQCIHRLADTVFNIAANIFVGIQLRFLGQVAHMEIWHRASFALDVGIQAGHDF